MMPVMRAMHYFNAGEWPASAARGTVTLAFADRHRRRVRLVLDEEAGEVLLDLPRATRLADGGGLKLSDGGWIGVRAACEDVLDIRAADTVSAMRIAWHLGNRHLPVQILPDARLRILYDHVIAAMVRDLGAVTAHCRAVFNAEGGAYEGLAPHGHGHTPDASDNHDTPDNHDNHAHRPEMRGGQKP